MTTEQPTVDSRPARTGLRDRRWAIPIILLAALVIAVAGVVGVRGLLANPIQSANPDGTATLHGQYQPFSCCPAQGYVQAGGRSVFVIFASACPEPGRDQEVTVRGRLDTGQGKQSYRALDCPTR